MIHPTSVDRYSSVVTMCLVSNGQQHPLSQIAPDFVVLKSPSQLPVGTADVIMSVDNEERQWNVIVLEADETSDVVQIQVV